MAKLLSFLLFSLAIIFSVSHVRSEELLEMRVQDELFNTLFQTCPSEEHDEALSTCAVIGLMDKCNFDDIFSNMKEITMFAPVDSAIGEDAYNYLEIDHELSCQMLKYFMVDGFYEDLDNIEELYSVLYGWPIHLSSVDNEITINADSAVAGTQKPPKVIKTSTLIDGDFKVVVHLIDEVETPIMTLDVLDKIAKDNDYDLNAQEKFTGRALGPFNPGFDTKQIYTGPSFSIRNAFGQLYFPFVGFFINLLQGYSSDPGLYCESVRCGG